MKNKMEENHDQEKMLKSWTKKGADLKMDMNPPVKWIKNGKGHGKRHSKPTKEKRRKKSRIRRIIEKKKLKIV